jgi:predicted metalloprotease
MKFDEGHRSEDVEDRRGQRMGGSGAMVGRLGIGGVLIVGALSLLFRRNLFGDLARLQGEAPATNEPVQSTPEEEKMLGLVSTVLDDAQATWGKLLPAAGTPYERAKLVVFTDSTQSGCGVGERAMGPFYCPADQKVYIDLGFYRELRQRLGAPGDFAQAYVIAHEIGHHVQNLLGTEAKLRREQAARPRDKNSLSVRMELQADCYAGIWAHSTSERKLLEEGDVDEALGAAAAVGDDRLQRQATGQVNPERWTHGSSAQRSQWFKKGFSTGRLDACDTFREGP